MSSTWLALIALAIVGGLVAWKLFASTSNPSGAYPGQGAKDARGMPTQQNAPPPDVGDDALAVSIAGAVSAGFSLANSLLKR